MLRRLRRASRAGRARLARARGGLLQLASLAVFVGFGATWGLRWALLTGSVALAVLGVAYDSPSGPDDSGDEEL